MTNADMRVAEVRQFCELDEASQQLIKAAMTQLSIIRTGLSSHFEIITNDCRIGRGGEYPIHTFSRGVAVPPQGDDGVV